MKEMLDICDTEGDSINGGGFFVVKHDAVGRQLVKHEGMEMGGMPMSMAMPPRGTQRGSTASVGEIGSPLSSSTGHPSTAFGGRPYNSGGGPPQQGGPGMTTPAGF